MKIVLQKFIAEAGICSRRAAQKLIEQGKVVVNQQIAKLGDRVDEEDEILVNGVKIVASQDKRYFLLHKPIGYACTHARVAGERSVYDLLPIKEKLFVTGRLDKNSHGLVFLTNDGALAQRLTHPSFEHEKEYRVVIDKETPISKNQGEKIARAMVFGVDIGENDGLVRAKTVRYLGNNAYVIILTYGKKRQIRRMFAVLGFTVVDLERVRIAGWRLGNLAVGKWRELKLEEINQ
ncbi:MAG: pseudouridine synthase [Candidatus Falkowbacteria bacterium]